jgi:hypothetical protein
MGLLGVGSAFLSWLLEPSLVFAKPGGVYVSGELLQGLDETFGAHVLKNEPGPNGANLTRLSLQIRYLWVIKL